MAFLSIRRKPSRRRRALRAAAKPTNLVKAQIARIAGRRAAKVAAPVVVVGTAALVAKRRGGDDDADDLAAAGTNAYPSPAGVA